MNDSGRTSRQEAVLHEAAARVRRYVGLAHHEKHHRPLIVVLTKADVWRHLLDDADLAEPFVQTGLARGLDLERIERMSKQVRELMQRICPEIVVAAESFAECVYFMPASALGQSPSPHPATGYPAIRPRDIRPVWTSVPFLFGLHRCLSGLIPGLRRKHALGNGNTSDGAPRVRRLPDIP